jgi:hypothetical protein
VGSTGCAAVQEISVGEMHALKVTSPIAAAFPETGRPLIRTPCGRCDAVRSVTLDCLLACIGDADMSYRDLLYYLANLIVFDVPAAHRH